MEAGGQNMLEQEPCGEMLTTYDFGESGGLLFVDEYKTVKARNTHAPPLSNKSESSLVFELCPID